MGGIRSNFLNYVRRYSKGKPFTESTATTALSRWLYKGHGPKYLSMPVCEDRIGRPPDATPRRFTCPTRRQDYGRWLPLRDHLTGDPKGIVSDYPTPFVPFVVVDIDRHTGAVPAKRHQEIVIQAGRYLQTIPHIKWLVEVNPKNGSTKFFGFLRSGQHIRIAQAQEVASRIHQELIDRGLCHKGKVEVFPKSCHAVFLPARRDKITIVCGGMLPRCTKKIRDYQFFREKVYEPIRCYSALHFMAWLHNGDNYNEDKLISALRHSCARLPDETPAENVAPSSKIMVPRRVTASQPSAETLADPVPIKPIAGANGYDPNEPDAFQRNWKTLLPFSRDFYRRNHRLPTSHEALLYLKENGFFSGRWQDNESNRFHRVTAILGKIKETFDPSLLSSQQWVQLDPKIRKWSRCQFPNGIVGHQRVINEMSMTCQTKSIRVPLRFVEHCVGVIAFCLNNPLENKALPVNRIKAIWDLVPNAPSWNQSYFQVVRDHLEHVGIVKIIDKEHQIGKAWKWDKGEKFPGERKSSDEGPTEVKERKEEKEIKEEYVYNTLYQIHDQYLQIEAHGWPNRAPPPLDDDDLETQMILSALSKVKTL